MPSLDSVTTDILKSVEFERIVTDNGEEVFVHKLASELGSVDLVHMPARRVYKPHRHESTSSTIYILEGEGIFHLSGDEKRYSPGDKMLVGRNEPHGFETLSDTYFVSVQENKIWDDKTGRVDLEYD